jgi:hypothetical protein
MKRRILFWAILPLLVLALGGVSQAGQGRMGGMGDPFGLISDESDFLIHPAKFAKGEGVKFYGNYRFTYTGVTDWDYDIVGYLVPGPVLAYTEEVDVSGDEYRHDALLGGGFPLGLGRMGLFFTYEGMRGNYDGNYVEGYPAPAVFETVEIQSNLDNFALRLLYGLPLDGFNLGGEAQFAYRQEKEEIYELEPPWAWLNDFYIPQYLYPYDSEYWQALLKGSLEGMIGPLDLEFTLRGGFIFGGDNEWDFEVQNPIGTVIGTLDLDGAVNGWQIGGDLWVRYPVADDLTLPFLVRIDYQTKTRDGGGSGSGTTAAQIDYEHEERDFALTVGGGVDKVLDTDSRIAGGIYYNYLQHREDFFWSRSNPPDWGIEDYTFPDFTEHQVLVRLAGEHSFSPAVALRGGLNVFFGWVIAQGEFYEDNSFLGWENTEGSGNGLHWGIGASLGATVHIVPGFTMEPFVSGGYQRLDLEGDAENIDNGVLAAVYDEGSSRGEWHIGGGCSFLFDLP